ncbi:MAG: hypothetical protein WC861_06365 [Candidatus Micrarchaeia archaeon]|jgi:hypothetical protein
MAERIISRFTKLGAGMVLVEGGPVDVVHAKSRWRVSAERFFRKAKINVDALNKNRLFRRFRLEVGTDQEYMEYRLSHGKVLSGKKQDKFIAGIAGAANSMLMQDMLVLGRANTEKGQVMLLDAIIGKHDEYPLPTMMGILQVERYASQVGAGLKPAANEKIKEYLEQHPEDKQFARGLMAKMLGNEKLDIHALARMFEPVLNALQGKSEK